MFKADPNDMHKHHFRISDVRRDSITFVCKGLSGFGHGRSYYKTVSKNKLYKMLLRRA